MGNSESALTIMLTVFKTTALRIACGLSLFGVSVLAGCGDGLEREPIIGMLTMQGKPIIGASVQFFPATGTPGEGAIGTTDNDGKFTVISSRNRDTGVPAGKYTVRVSLLVDGKGKPLPPDALQADFPDARESIPSPYSTAASPIEVQIPDGGGQIQVEVPGGKRRG